MRYEYLIFRSVQGMQRAVEGTEKTMPDRVMKEHAVYKRKDGRWMKRKVVRAGWKK